ncbi:MAG TPA: Crp/Fnr family transcriptional regulator [Candidatus Saccharimonadales bacterium]
MESTVSQKLEDFFASYALQRFDKGHILICAAEDPPGVMYLVSGQVIKYDITDRGTQVVLNTYKPPAFFPMSWGINKGLNQFFYEAGTKVLLRQAPPEEVIDFLKNNTDVLFDLVSRIYRGADGLLRRMSHLMTSTARTRMIYELIVECRRFGKQLPDGSFILAKHEGELGARAGLSRETVSRELGSLKSQGIVRVDRENISVTDIALLEKEIDAIF